MSKDWCTTVLHLDYARGKKGAYTGGISFMEIKLTKHPEKRNGMLALSDGLAIPQAFIGGANDLLSICQEY
eukprot:scaffold374_cov124-Cylindrotheca_fusiformis.AAC.11